jgi:hypothetical protein
MSTDDLTEAPEEPRPPFLVRLSWSPILVPLAAAFFFYLGWTTPGSDREWRPIFILSSLAILIVANALHVWSVDDRFSDLERRLRKLESSSPDRSRSGPPASE